MTPADLFTETLVQCRVLGRGQHVSAEQLTSVQRLCNMMLGQWARKRWLIFHLLEIYTTGTGSPFYQLGPNDVNWDSGGSWDQSGLSFDMSTRTNRLEKAFVRMYPGTPQQIDRPLQVIRDAEDWSTIPAKNISAGFPQIVFLDAGYPVATLNVWPAPSSQYEIHVLILNPLIRINELNVEINLPDEYQDALFWNLCRRVFSSYGKPMDPETNIQASAALNTVKNANFQLPQLRMPDGLVRGWNYNGYTDTYN